MVERVYVYKIHIISGFNRGPIVWLRNSERIYLVQPTTHYKLRGPAGPQGCVLSPILFSVHANNIFIQDCLCKYASNAALVGLSRRVKAGAWAMCCVVMQDKSAENKKPAVQLLLQILQQWLAGVSAGRRYQGGSTELWPLKTTMNLRANWKA